MRVAYLGPAGTYTHQALLASAPRGEDLDAQPRATIHAVVSAVQAGEAERGVVPIENSVEGSVNATLDALAFDAPTVRIVAETILPIHHCLIARPGVSVDQIRVVISHPQALGQCAGFLRARLPDAEPRTATSTVEAVRTVVAAEREPWAALAPRSAAEHYGASVLAANAEDAAGNVTRFAWLARARAREDGPGSRNERARSRDGGPGPRKTAIVLWPRESDHPGWLVGCLAEFSGRGINLTRIESRPRKLGLGEYVFFVDLDGAVDDSEIARGLAAVRAHSELRVLGSFAAAPPPVHF